MWAREIAMIALALLAGVRLWTANSNSLIVSSDSTTKGHNHTTLHSKFSAAVGVAQSSFLNSNPSHEKAAFDLSTWTKRTKGGLKDKDRTLLAQLYGNASSVFEYGLGESTYIANHVGVQRYAGIDSDADWVTQARDKVPDHYRFYFADIGKTKSWGYPESPTLPKNVYDYQIAPLVAESRAFDVYMVDGRWRKACVLLCFLHASDRGEADTTVLIHDCMPPRDYCKVLDPVLEKVQFSGDQLCVYKRRKNTTDDMLYDLWLQHANDPA